MCAINPTYHMRIHLDVYTSNPNMTKAIFEDLVFEKILEAEVKLNEDMRLRWHANVFETIEKEIKQKKAK